MGENEAPTVGELRDDLVTGLAGTVTRARFDVHQNFAIAARRSLETRSELSRMHRIDAAVGLRCCDEHRGIGNTVAHVVIRRIRA